MPVFECSRCNEMTYSASGGAAVPCANCGSERQRVIDGYFDQARHSDRSVSAGDHALLVCDHRGEATSFCTRFLAEGVERGERVVSALPAELTESVKAALSPEVESAVQWNEPRDFYADFDADRVASTYEGLIVDVPRTTRVLAGLDRDCADGVDPEDLARYEAIAHDIITRLGANVLCVYDSGSLRPELIDVAVRGHGLSVKNGAVRRNERFKYQPA
jgi:DcmR-like sensory protein